jgi:hypothetical protein
MCRSSVAGDTVEGLLQPLFDQGVQIMNVALLDVGNCEQNPESLLITWRIAPHIFYRRSEPFPNDGVTP